FLRHVPVGHGIPGAVGIVGGGNEYVIVFGQPPAPGVVTRGRQLFAIGTAGPEPLYALTETEMPAIHRCARARRRRHSPDLVIESVDQVGRSGMRIVFPPSGDDVFADVRDVVAVGIFDEHKMRRLRYDDSTVCKYDAGR